MGKISDIHGEIVTLISGVSGVNQTFTERPKEITDEKLPAVAVYYEGHDNQVSSSRTNKRTYSFAIEVIYDKEDLDVTRTVVSDLVSDVIDVLEATENARMGGYAHYTLPTKCERVQDYQVAGKHYIAYRITLPVVSNETV